MKNARKSIATEYYKEGKIELDTLGFLAADNFSDKIIVEAYDRYYITCGMAGELLKAKNTD